MSLIKNIGSMIVVHPLNQMMLAQFALKASANKNEKMYTCVLPVLLTGIGNTAFLLPAKLFSQIPPVSCDYNGQNRYLY